MNSLEFIEKEIANIREFLELDDVLCLQTEEDYKFWYDRLKTLQQIKTELEAWEVVKKYGVAYLKEKNYLELSLIYANCPENKNYQKLKKALEVK